MKRIRRLLAQPEGPRTGLIPVFSVVILTLTLAGAMAAWQTRPAAAGPRQSAATAAVVPAAAPATPLAAAVQVAQAPAPVRKQGAPEETQADSGSSTPYRKWLNEDAAYIITDAERAAFKNLPTDSEREKFIEQFWLRRDPTPGTPENEFKEEHYRRIGYANQHFAGIQGLPGWKTDRGRIYITFGPPDEIESHPSGGTYQRPASEGGATANTYPFEQWRYRFIQGIGSNIMIEFVDPAKTGEYRMTSDPTEKLAAAAAWPYPATGGRRGGPGAAVKAGTTLQMVGNNGVRISVPLDQYGDHLVNLYVRLIAGDGSVVKTFFNALQGQMAFSRFLALAPGSYQLRVAVNDMVAGTAATDTIPFEVK